MAGETLLHLESGTPQGGVASPLLANVVVHRLDRTWIERYRRLGVLVRYSDLPGRAVPDQGACRGGARSPGADPRRPGLVPGHGEHPCRGPAGSWLRLRLPRVASPPGGVLYPQGQVLLCPRALRTCRSTGQRAHQGLHRPVGGCRSVSAIRGTPQPVPGWVAGVLCLRQTPLTVHTYARTATVTAGSCRCAGFPPSLRSGPAGSRNRRSGMAGEHRAVLGDCVVPKDALEDLARQAGPHRLLHRQHDQPGGLGVEASPTIRLPQPPCVRVAIDHRSSAECSARPVTRSNGGGTR
jgi:hypothetical protein